MCVPAWSFAGSERTRGGVRLGLDRIVTQALQPKGGRGVRANE